MKYVDEFRDPELIMKTAEEIRRLDRSAAALPHHGSLRRPHARDLSLWLERRAARKY